MLVTGKIARLVRVLHIRGSPVSFALHYIAKMASAEAKLIFRCLPELLANRVSAGLKGTTNRFPQNVPFLLDLKKSRDNSKIGKKIARVKGQGNEVRLEGPPGRRTAGLHVMRTALLSRRPVP